MRLFSMKSVVARLALALCLVEAANAAGTVFNVTGTLGDGASFNGTLTIDTVTPNSDSAVLAADITVGPPDSLTCTSVNTQRHFAPPPNSFYVVNLFCTDGAYLVLSLATPNNANGYLTGYTGGRIISGSLLIPDEGPILVTSGTVTPAPVTTVLDPPFLVRYASNLQFGESYINISNDGANGAPLSGPGVGGAVGNICVNVYAFDPNEEMISCCSCLLTPDQTRNLGVNRDILSNTATGVVPTSVTIKLLATLAGSGGSGTSCTSSAAGVATATVVNGLVAFGTTLHATPTAGNYDTTETPFIPATLSAEEQAALANRCTNIVGNLSGFGICASCRAGALGAGKM